VRFTTSAVKNRTAPPFAKTNCGTEREFSQFGVLKIRTELGISKTAELAY